MKPEQYPYEPEFTFKQLLQKRQDDFWMLWKHRYTFIILAVIGAGLGAIYAWIKPVTYTSKLTFVVEEGGSGGGSLLSGLAGQFGLELGGMSGTGGVLAGDNVQELLRSQKMIKNTLLTPFNRDSTLTLADKYAETSNLSKQWAEKYNNAKTIRFPIDIKYNRLQDSLLQVMVKNITDYQLSVNKTDKKLTFFEASVTMANEEVAQLFTTRLIEEATRFYIETKTLRQRTNVSRLQTRADSIGKLLSQKTYSASAANSVLLDINPAYPTANVNVELKERDKMVLQTIYAEIVKNLEVSRTMLIQETPAFQIVDEPELPLKKNRTGYLKSMVLGGLILGFIYALYLLLVRK